MINAISKLIFSLFIQLIYHQIDYDRQAHDKETDVQKCMRQREIRDVGYLITCNNLIRNSSQNSDE
jgi:hypothetical protein